MANGSLKLDSGHLLDTGQFKVVFSQILDPIYYSSIEDFRPFSGRPVLDEQMFAGYKGAGAIPAWRCSRATFAIGFGNYVIVSTAGIDPNPIPVITFQPQSERVLVGDSAYFGIDTAPLGYLAYQWRFRDKPIPGETSLDLYIDNVKPANAGVYSVAVNAGGKSVVSKYALLQVVKPVAVTTPPKSQTVHTGKPVVFRVAVSGTGPFKYQWFFNYAPITNATKSFYSIPKVKAGDAGDYWVDVNNGLSFDSSDAVLTVIP